MPCRLVHILPLLQFVHGSHPSLSSQIIMMLRVIENSTDGADDLNVTVHEAKEYVKNHAGSNR